MIIGLKMVGGDSKIALATRGYPWPTSVASGQHWLAAACCSLLLAGCGWPDGGFCWPAAAAGGLEVAESRREVQKGRGFPAKV